MSERPAASIGSGALLAGLGAMLLVAALVGVAAIGATDSGFGPGAASGAGTDEVIDFGGGQGGGGQPSIPDRPEADPVFGPGALVSAFDEDRSGLAPPTAPDGSNPVGSWDLLSGDWSQVGGKAVVASAAGPRSIALVHPAVAPRAVEVTLARVASNAGLVARYVDDRHYMVLVTVPAKEQLWLARVDGDSRRPRLLAAVQDVPLEPGTTIGLRLAPERVTVVVNGKGVRLVGLPPAAPDANGVGLVAAGAGSRTDAAFDDFRLSPG